jgi:hypothetical protein
MTVIDIRHMILVRCKLKETFGYAATNSTPYSTIPSNNQKTVTRCLTHKVKYVLFILRAVWNLARTKLPSLIEGFRWEGNEREERSCVILTRWPERRSLPVSN